MEDNLDKFQFYTDLLRKLELIRFTVNFNGISHQQQENKKFSLEIDNVRLKDEDDPLVYQTIASKFGKDYYSK